MNNYDKKFNNIAEVISEREELFQVLKDEIQTAHAEDFKYYENIANFKDLIERLESLREIELDFITNK